MISEQHMEMIISETKEILWNVIQKCSEFGGDRAYIPLTTTDEMILRHYRRIQRWEQKHEKLNRS